MDIQKLKHFCIVAKHLNFSKAAEECHMAQPAMSRSISSLEYELGFPLFDRTHHSVELTPAGTYFLPEAAKIVEAYEFAKQSGSTIFRTSTSTLDIGFGGFDRNFAKFYVGEFMKLKPTCTIMLRAFNYDNLFESLISGTSDVIFSSEIRIEGKESVNSTIISDSEYMIGVGRDHPLSRYNEITPSMLNGLTFICPTDITMSWNQKAHLSTVFNHYGISPGRIARTNSTDSLIAMLELRMGVTFLSKDIVLSNDRVKMLRIIHDNPARKVHVAAHLLPAKRPIVTEFLQFVKSLPFSPEGL